MKKLISICLVLALSLSLCSCTFLQDLADYASNPEAQSKVFEFEGLSIELTTDFLRMGFISEDYDCIISDGTLTIMGMKILNEDTEQGDLTVLEYAEDFRSAMEDSDPTEITEIDCIPVMQYTESADGEEQKIAVAFYKGTDCFWVICFASTPDIFDDLYDDICKYAKTVECD